ncbi:DUF1015 domain-containing protein [Zongyangia hominis]|uniref:DUF1015 domain-containing protein n=1 Tax=Zongyangia hominis TaxID=2763677 RepID=A0A926ICT3_9FIRM|nr:DUF1015 domain-containing protein [Zongyangia hominis]MBC8571440.1 DUF1015 domain-containing protein [Zongyangia hominis]
MATVKGFRGVRFTEKAGTIAELCCPPYDIISEEQRQNYLAQNPHNVIRLELPRGEHPYEEAAKTLQTWLSNGVLSQDEKEGLYIYEEEFTARGVPNKIKGFICLVKVEDFSKGVVLPHEETLSKAKTDRFNLQMATGCQFSQIYSLYIDHEHTTLSLIDALSDREPDAVFTDEGDVTHRLWCVYDEDVIAQVGQQFAGRKLYIADGHHRYETSINIRNALREKGVITDDSHPGNYVMMMLCDMEHPGLVVFPTHRLIRDMPDVDIPDLLKKCEEFFDITPALPLSSLQEKLDEDYAQGKKSFALYTGSQDYTLLTLRDLGAVKRLEPKMSDDYCNLDVSVLHTLVLEHILGIDKENMMNQVNLNYTRVLEEAIDKVQDGTYNFSFIMNPTKVEEIGRVAEGGEKMPQKSTYFYPKLTTGLVMNKFMDL